LLGQSSRDIKFESSNAAALGERKFLNTNILQPAALVQLVEEFLSQMIY
jgi:hypothetical protein